MTKNPAEIYQLDYSKEFLDAAMGIISQNPDYNSIHSNIVARHIHQAAVSFNNNLMSDFEKFDIWKWRNKLIEKIALSLDSDGLSVVNFYIFGSTKNATAGACSDIDIIVHFRGDSRQLEELRQWLGRWSKGLSALNFTATGCRTNGLLDVHIVTDEDIEKQTSYAAKIDAVCDAARRISLRRKS